jgi:hypothetical protein
VYIVNNHACVFVWLCACVVVGAEKQICAGSLDIGSSTRVERDSRIAVRHRSTRKPPPFCVEIVIDLFLKLGRY